MEIKWNEIEKVGLPEYSHKVWVAGEMPGNEDGEMVYFVARGRLDVDKWKSAKDWYERQDYFKVTHWAEINKQIKKPKHPLTNEYLY